MKVVVTGAAGRMGSESCEALRADGHEVIATDRVQAPPGRPALRVADLLDAHAVEAAFGDGSLDAVVHLGNHISYAPPDPRMIYNENVAMNMNVFQSAADRGAKRIVFASSIQAIVSQPELPHGKMTRNPPYFPLDGDTPARPTNPYGLSKQVGEVMADYFVRVYEMSGVALRLPWLGSPETIAAIIADKKRKSPYDAPMGFSYLSYRDAGLLVAAILRADLPGFRIYTPASLHNRRAKPAHEVIAEFLPDAPLRSPLNDAAGESLVDISAITRETGWQPRD